MRAPKRKKEDIEIPTSSLADIVFLLLIFFLVSTSMNPSKGLGLTLPPPGEEIKMDKENILTIYINAAGNVLVREDVITIDQIKDRVTAEIQANDKLVVSLRTDPDAKYDAMIQVLDQLKLADAKRISLATPDF
jgi:biopolymer transport protein ExbD